MADKSKIEWCDATWNPMVGCSPVSPGCDHCYAARMAHRLGQNPATPQYAGLAGPDGKWLGKTRLVQSALDAPLRWKKSKRIFVASMGDLFHPSFPFAWVDKIFARMILAPQHTYILLTTRPDRMCQYLESVTPGDLISASADAPCDPAPLPSFPLANVILMTTVEDQPRADERMPHLMRLAGMGWKTGVSIEPMLGPVDLGSVTIGDHGEIRKTWDVLRGTSSTHHPVFGCGGVAPGRLSWVIVGGESGPNARPMHPAWVRSLRDQCKASGVPFFMKQWGEWAPTREDPYDKAEPRRIGEHGRDTANLDNCTPDMGNDVYVYRVGKHAAGRLLDGVEWNEFPEVRR